MSSQDIAKLDNATNLLLAQQATMKALKESEHSLRLQLADLMGKYKDSQMQGRLQKDENEELVAELAEGRKERLILKRFMVDSCNINFDVAVMRDHQLSSFDTSLRFYLPCFKEAIDLLACIPNYSSIDHESLKTLYRDVLSSRSKRGDIDGRRATTHGQVEKSRLQIKMDRFEKMAVSVCKSIRGCTVLSTQMRNDLSKHLRSQVETLQGQYDKAIASIGLEHQLITMLWEERARWQVKEAKYMEKNEGLAFRWHRTMEENNELRSMLEEERKRSAMMETLLKAQPQAPDTSDEHPSQQSSTSINPPPSYTSDKGLSDLECIKDALPIPNETIDLFIDPTPRDHIETVYVPRGECPVGQPSDISDHPVEIRVRHNPIVFDRLCEAEFGLKAPIPHPMSPAKPMTLASPNRPISLVSPKKAMKDSSPNKSTHESHSKVTQRRQRSKRGWKVIGEDAVGADRRSVNDRLVE